jgi:fructuronate reductase
VLYCDRETVDKIEKMKVCTCLNPLHTAMSIYGCMLGYNLISAEMADEDLPDVK